MCVWCFVKYSTEYSTVKYKKQNGLLWVVVCLRVCLLWEFSTPDKVVHMPQKTNREKQQHNKHLK